ncbi:unnamed protein product [Trichobilharzia regenti]|nr:unnamed protein product [Trichobilharzia regenti]
MTGTGNKLQTTLPTNTTSSTTARRSLERNKPIGQNDLTLKSSLSSSDVRRMIDNANTENRIPASRYVSGNRPTRLPRR